MATTLTDFMTNLETELKSDTLSTTSYPTLSQVYQALYECYDWITGICIDLESEIGRRTTSISLTDGTADYTDIQDDVIAVADRGWLEKTYSRDEIYLANEFEIIDYSPSSTNETEPDKYKLDANGKLTFMQTPETSYTAKIPNWYHQSKPTGKTFTISGATQANPCVITTTAAHCFKTGDRTYIESVVGMTQLNGYWYTVTRVSSTTFSLDGVNSTAYTAYGSVGTAHVALPFNGIFDNIILRYVAMKFQNINEYNQQYEQSWLSAFLEMVRHIIISRKGGLSVRVVR